MRRAFRAARVAAFTAVCAFGGPVARPTSLPIGGPPAEMPAITALAGSVAAMTATNAGVGTVSGTERARIEVWMAGHQQAAQRFVEAVSTPGSASYHRYLSPSAYTRRFGASPAQLNAVESYLRGAGFTGVHASVNGDYVSAISSVSTINQAFRVQVRRYQVSGAAGNATTIESNNRELSVPASVASDILAITGLNGTQPQTDTASAPGAGANRALCSRYWAQKTQTFTPAFDGLTEGAAPVCGYSAKQIRAGYGLTSADTGKGKTIALIEVGVPNKMFQTLTDYAKANRLRVPRRDQYRQEAIGGGARNHHCIDAALEEIPLDSEAAYAMAPDANQLMVDGNACDTKDHGDQALLNAMLAPLTGHGSRPRVAIESVSYGIGTDNERTTPRSDLRTSHAIALRAAAEGVSLLASSGDRPGVEPPASDPAVTAVGGTTLGIGAHNRRVFETGWSTAFAERTGTTGPWTDDGILGAGSGGVSSIYPEPGYQKGVVPSAMAKNSMGQAGRAVPDIAADADPYSGMLFGVIIHGSKYVSFRQAGTSTAAPLVAGIVADAEQGTRKDLGFLNPLLYSLAGSRAFHDILPLGASDPQVDRAYYTTGNTYINGKNALGFLLAVNDEQDPRETHQVTAPGYDTMTGLGTPNGSAFIKALRLGKKEAG